MLTATGGSSDCVGAMSHTYELGTRAWQPDPTDGWVGSEVKERKVEGDKVKLIFLLDNGEVRETPSPSHNCTAD